MKIGYARTSTTSQAAGLEAQIAKLTAAGCEEVYREQVSAVSDVRELETAVKFARKGDVLVVTSLDRLARSVRDLMNRVAALEAKGVSLQILDMNLDTSTSTGKLMLSVLGSVAEFERNVMLERQRAGIEKARADGKYKGRSPTAQRKADEVVRLLVDGLTEHQVAERVGISRSSVSRIKRGRGLVRRVVEVS